MTVGGTPVANHGDDEGWRKTRLRWLNATLGNADEPTAPYTPVSLHGHTLSWLGGEMTLSAYGLPASVTTRYDANNGLDTSGSEKIANPVLAREMRFVIETEEGEETLIPGRLRVTGQNNASISWETTQKSKNFTVTCQGSFGFDGIGNFRLQVKPRREIHVKDIRLEAPYTAYASRYMMGLGHKGGFRPEGPILWQWDTNRHQDKIWMGNVNAGMNLHFMDEQYTRPLVNTASRPDKTGRLFSPHTAASGHCAPATRCITISTCKSRPSSPSTFACKPKNDSTTPTAT